MGTLCPLCACELSDTAGEQVCRDVSDAAGCHHVLCTGCILAEAWEALADVLQCPQLGCCNRAHRLNRRLLKVTTGQEETAVELSRCELARGRQLPGWLLPGKLREFWGAVHGK